MRNPDVAAIYGHGRSRSKPLYRKSLCNVLIQHRGRLKLGMWLDRIIKQSTPVKKVSMKKLNIAIQRGIADLKNKAIAAVVPKKKFKLNIKMP